MGVLARKIPLDGGGSSADRRAAQRGPATILLDDDPAAAGLLIGLECVGRGAAVLDRDGRFIGANARGEALLALLGHDPVHWTAYFRGLPPAASRQLDCVIRLALVEGAEAAAAISVSASLTLVMRAIPLAAGACRFRRARVLLALAPIGGDLLPSVGFVREVFGLTATEAEVALALAGGASTTAIARDRAVSHETVRSHLKTIYAKTGTKRQASLVAAIVHLRDVAPTG